MRLILHCLLFCASPLFAQNIKNVINYELTRSFRSPKLYAYKAYKPFLKTMDSLHVSKIKMHTYCIDKDSTKHYSDSITAEIKNGNITNVRAKDWQMTYHYDKNHNLFQLVKKDKNGIIESISTSQFDSLSCPTMNTNYTPGNYGGLDYHWQVYNTNFYQDSLLEKISRKTFRQQPIIEKFKYDTLQNAFLVQSQYSNEMGETTLYGLNPGRCWFFQQNGDSVFISFKALYVPIKELNPDSIRNKIKTSPGWRTKLLVKGKLVGNFVHRLHYKEEHSYFGNGLVRKSLIRKNCSGGEYDTVVEYYYEFGK